MTRPASDPLPLAVLISGGGTTLRNLLAKIDDEVLAARIDLVMSSNPKAKGLAYATAAGIRTAVLERQAFSDDTAYGQAVFSACREAGVELVVMAGFLKFTPIPPDFENRVMNIHPGLIPAFCGAGMYGHHVHQAVIDYGAKVSGCTVHFVDNQYDHGPIVVQSVVPVYDDDTADTLATRVFEAECHLYPEAINLYAHGRLKLVGRRVHIRSDE